MYVDSSPQLVVGECFDADVVIECWVINLRLISSESIDIFFVWKRELIHHLGRFSLEIFGRFI